MSTLYEKIIAVVMGVHNRSLTYRARREKLARTRKEIQSDRLYPWDVGTGSVFRNVENLTMYLYTDMVLEMTVGTYSLTKAGLTGNIYQDWARTSSIANMTIIRAILTFHCVKPNGITATDILHRLQDFNISASQIKRVIADGFELGTLREIENEHRERYFRLTDECWRAAQESLRMRFSNINIARGVQHMSKLYAMTSLIGDKLDAEKNDGVEEHEPTSFQQIIDLINEDRDKPGVDHLDPVVVPMNPLKKKQA